MRGRFLLDTNILSNLIRNPNGLVADRIERIGYEEVATSIVVAAELRYGAEKSRSPRLRHRVSELLLSLELLLLDVPADTRYADLRTSLKRAGNIISPNDMLLPPRRWRSTSRL